MTGSNTASRPGEAIGRLELGVRQEVRRLVITHPTGLPRRRRMPSRLQRSLACCVQRLRHRIGQADPGDELLRPHPSYRREITTRRKDDAMSADTRVEERRMSGLSEVDEPAFSELAERHRRELHVHCYRMLGVLRRRRGRRAGDVPAGLAAPRDLRRDARRSGPGCTGSPPTPAWTCSPAPAPAAAAVVRRGAVAAALPRPAARRAARRRRDEPDAVAVARETIELAFLVAVQHLAPRQRAVLILRDVLGLACRRTSRSCSDDSVNSVEQRAAAGPRRHAGAPARRTAGLDRRARRTPGRASWCAATPMPASPRTSTALAALLRDDVRSSMPPTPGLYVGRDAVVSVLGRGAASRACRGCAPSPPP